MEVDASDGAASGLRLLEVVEWKVLSTSWSSSSRRDDFRLGLDSEVVDEFARVFLREMADSFSWSSLRLDLETSEPALDLPELDRPKLNMMATSLASGYIIVRSGRSRVEMSVFVSSGIVVQGSICVALRRVANAVANR